MSLLGVVGCHYDQVPQGTDVAEAVHHFANMLAKVQLSSDLISAVYDEAQEIKTHRGRSPFPPRLILVDEQLLDPGQ
jgi:hypothetical protein